MNKITFTAFADYHYFPGSYPIYPEGIDVITKRAHDSQSGLIVSLGDFMHDSTDAAVFDKMAKNEYGIPFIGCYGNHELERVGSLEALNAAYGVENSYFFRDISGYRFIVLDNNNYRADDGGLVHYKGWSWGGVTYGGKDSNALGDEQLAWLEKVIASSPFPVIILSHVSFVRDAGDSEDAGKVRAIINAANEKSPRKVIMCLNGHYHRNLWEVKDNVLYFGINAAYNGAWVPHAHDLFPEDFTNGIRMAKNCAIFKDPLSATFTVEGDGKITVKGTATEYMYGVTPEMIGAAVQTASGRSEPFIPDIEVTLE